MRRTDYILVSQTLAQALNECRTEPISGVILTIEQFMDNLAIDNLNFDRLQFLENILDCTVNERGVMALNKRINNLKAYLNERVTVF